MIYLQLSFISECIEKLSLLQMSIPSNAIPEEASDESLKYPTRTLSSETSSASSLISNGEAIQNIELPNSTPKYSLDGFNFRRALNDAAVIGLGDSALLYGQKPNENGTLELYQLSLYIQNDASIEQKSDSKVTIQCSSKSATNTSVDKNQNASKMNYTSRRVDQPQLNQGLPSSPSGRLIVPTAHLTVLERKLDNANQSSETVFSELIDSRIDILSGKIPNLKIIETPVGIGDDVTLIIRAKELGKCLSK